MRHGCLIIALGSPDEPTPREIRRFLKSFLSDRRVVDFHPALWAPILHGIVLPFRPGRIAGEWHIKTTAGRRIESPEVAALAAEITAELRKEIARNAR